MLLHFSIEKVDHQFFVTLKNTQGFSTYKGKVVYSKDTGAVIQLFGCDKNQYLFLGFDETGNGEVFVGLYLKHNRDGKLFAGTFIVEKPNQDQPIQPKVIPYGSEDMSHIDPGIVEFFRKRHLNFLKAPRLFTKHGVKNWIALKKKQRGERKENRE